MAAIRLVVLSGVAGSLGCSSGNGERSGGGEGGMSVAGGGGATSAGGSTGGMGAMAVAASGGQGFGGDTTGGGGAGGTGSSLTGGASGMVETAPGLRPFIAAFCATARICCAKDDWPPYRLADCEANAAILLDTTGILAGRVTLNETAMAACTTAYEHAAVTCSTDEVFPACRNVYTGNVPIGGSCNHAVDCKQDQGPTACFATSYMTDAPYLLMGVCRLEPAGKLGDACMASCPAGADCSTAFTTDTPDQSITLCHEKDGLFCSRDYVCAALSPRGGTCGSEDSCPATDYCHDDDPEMTACTPRNAPGAACAFNRTCTTGYTCQDNHCLPRPLADDRSCSSVPRYPRNAN